MEWGVEAKLDFVKVRGKNINPCTASNGLNPNNITMDCLSVGAYVASSLIAKVLIMTVCTTTFWN